MVKANLKVQIRMPKSAVHRSTEIKTEPASEIDLEEFVKKVPSEKEKIGVLEQISLSLLEETTIENTPAVLNELVNIYCFILTAGKHDEYSVTLTVDDLQCSDPIVALDIIGKMGSPRKATRQEILQHPFFWNDYLKIQFLCRVTDYINRRPKYSPNLATEKSRYVADVVSKRGWIEQLKLTEYEIEKAEKKYSRASENMIYNIAKKSGGENSVFGLLSFLQNLAVHPYHYSGEIWIIFDGFPEGFWNFFSSRFPNLFMYVHTHMQTYILTSHISGEFLNRRSPMIHIAAIHYSIDSDLGSKIKMKKHDDDDMAKETVPPEVEDYAVPQRSDLQGTSYSIEVNKGPKEEITTQKTFEDIKLGTTGFDMPGKPFFDEDIKEEKISVQKKPFASGFPKPDRPIFSSGSDLPGTSYSVKGNKGLKEGIIRQRSFQDLELGTTGFGIPFFGEDIKEEKISVQKKSFAFELPKPDRSTFSSGPYIPSFLVKDKRKEKTSPHEIRQVIDAEVESMRETKIFALEHQQLDEDSVKYFCSKLDSGFKLSELKFKDCGVDKLFLLTLLDNNLEGKVKILNLSENKNLDFSMISKLLAKLQCCSLDVTNMEFLETDLGKLEVKKLILNYGTFPKSISLTLAELLKKGMEELSLVDGNISCEQLQEIYKTLSENEMLSLKVLDLSHIYLEEKEGLEAISMIINRAKGDFVKLRLFNCEIDADSLRAFTEMIDKKINEFVIGCNAKVVEEDMQAVIDAARKVGAEKLDLSSLSLKEHHILRLKDSQLSKSGKISDLNLSDNSEMEGDVVGELVKAWGIKRLNISLCQFIEKDYKAMVAALGDYKLESIRCNDLSRSVRCEEYTDILKKVTDQIFLKM